MYAPAVNGFSSPVSGLRAMLLLYHCGTKVKRRKLTLKAKRENGISHFSFKRLVPCAFNVGLIG